MAISEEKGLEYCHIYPKAVDQEKVLEYLTLLHSKNKNAKIALFMDNLAVHKCKDVKAKIAAYGWKSLMNVPYAPDFSPVESCFSVIKNYYKRKRTEYLVNEKDIKEEDIIRESMK